MYRFRNRNPPRSVKCPYEIVVRVECDGVRTEQAEKIWILDREFREVFSVMGFGMPNGSYEFADPYVPNMRSNSVYLRARVSNLLFEKNIWTEIYHRNLHNIFSHFAPMRLFRRHQTPHTYLYLKIKFRSELPKSFVMELLLNGVGEVEDLIWNPQRHQDWDFALVRFGRGSRAQEIQYNPPNPMSTFGLLYISDKVDYDEDEKKALQKLLRDYGVLHKIVFVGGKLYVKMSELSARDLVGREVMIGRRYAGVWVLYGKDEEPLEIRYVFPENVLTRSQYTCQKLSFQAFDVGGRIENVIDQDDLRREQQQNPDRVRLLDTPFSIVSENEPMPLARTPGGQPIEVDYEFLDDIGQIGYQMDHLHPGGAIEEEEHADMEIDPMTPVVRRPLIQYPVIPIQAQHQHNNDGQVPRNPINALQIPHMNQQQQIYQRNIYELPPPPQNHHHQAHHPQHPYNTNAQQQQRQPQFDAPRVDQTNQMQPHPIQRLDMQPNMQMPHLQPDQENRQHHPHVLQDPQNRANQEGQVQMILYPPQNLLLQQAQHRPAQPLPLQANAVNHGNILEPVQNVPPDQVQYPHPAQYPAVHQAAPQEVQAQIPPNLRNQANPIHGRDRRLDLDALLQAPPPNLERRGSAPNLAAPINTGPDVEGAPIVRPDDIVAGQTGEERRPFKRRRQSTNSAAIEPGEWHAPRNFAPEPPNHHP